MPNITPYKKELLVKRVKMMEELEKEGYNRTDISFIFNLERTAASRILAYSKTQKTTKE